MTDRERKVYEAVKKDDSKGRGLPADFYYMLGGLDSEMTLDEVKECLCSLCEQEELVELMAISGPVYAVNRKKKESSAQGNFFAALMEKFAAMEQQTLIASTAEALQQWINASGMTDGNRIMQTMIISASVGIGGVAALSEKQKIVADAVFATVYKGEMEIVYPLLCAPVDDNSYGLLEMFCSIGKDAVGVPLLHYVLGFAYADGGLTPESAKRLEEIFGAVLLIDFMKNGPVE